MSASDCMLRERDADTKHELVFGAYGISAEDATQANPSAPVGRRTPPRRPRYVSGLKILANVWADKHNPSNCVIE